MPRALEVFTAFLKLGFIAFGGPVAHLGFFRDEFVQKRKWLDDAAYADLVALCQFMPGPASSQVGFALGLKRAGLPGAFAAWLAFTTPSAAIMIAFAVGLAHFGDLEGAGWIAGLKLAAAAVVANAIANMAASLCPDRLRAFLALAVAAILVAYPSAPLQVALIAAGLAFGALFYRHATEANPSTLTNNGSKSWGAACLATFAFLLIGLPIVSQAVASPWLDSLDTFYRAGSLVFGGGHVVLPLLESATVGPDGVSRDTFLAGYGVTQAMPGPLFTFSAFLGAASPTEASGIPGGIWALVSIYLPSWLLLLGIMPFWESLRRHPLARAALLGANAAVVGLLLAAFYNPIWTSAILGPAHAAFALLAFALLRFAKTPPWALVIASGAAGHFLL